MQSIVLVMGRKPIAQCLMKRLGPDIQCAFESEYDKASAAIHSRHAGVALIEVGETGDYDTARCLMLCREIRKDAPGCKLVLMCPEQNRASVAAAVRAKKDRRIDDFVFYDASLDYLISKLLSML